MLFTGPCIAVCHIHHKAVVHTSEQGLCTAKLLPLAVRKRTCILCQGSALIYFGLCQDPSLRSGPGQYKRCSYLEGASGSYTKYCKSIPLNQTRGFALNSCCKSLANESEDQLSTCLFGEKRPNIGRITCSSCITFAMNSIKRVLLLASDIKVGEAFHRGV